VCISWSPQYKLRSAAVFVSSTVQRFSNWNCILGMYIDDALMGVDIYIYIYISM
jgi:glutaredoxin-related protein